MKKVFFSLAAASIVILISSCASGGIAAVDSTLDKQDISVPSLNRSDYVILGYVSGEGSIVASDKQIMRDRSGLRPSKRMLLQNDTFRYGYISDYKPAAMTVEETAVANAMYKMIKQAETNGADTVAFVQTHISIIPKITDNGKQSFFNPQSTVTAKVTAIAIKIKSEVPALQPAPIAEPEDLDPAATFKLEKANAEKAAREKAAAEASPAAVTNTTEADSENTGSNTVNSASAAVPASTETSAATTASAGTSSGAAAVPATVKKQGAAQ